MNKMFDGMMAGKPIIFAVNAPPTPVGESGCGLIVEPEKPDEINKAVRQLMDMEPAKREQMGINGRNAVLEHYTYEKLARQFAELF